MGVEKAIDAAVGHLTDDSLATDDFVTVVNALNTLTGTLRCHWMLRYHFENCFVLLARCDLNALADSQMERVATSDAWECSVALRRTASRPCSGNSKVCV